MTAPAATAVIVTYNSAAHISAAVAGLTGTQVDVIVVDNGSTDATVAIMRRNFPAITLIQLDANVGFARAVNRALVDVETEVVLLINPDCVVPPDTVRALVEFLDAHRDVGLVGPRLLDGEGAIAVSAHPFETLASVVLSRFGGSLVPVGVRRAFSGPRRRRAYDVCRSTEDEATSVDWLSGACLAIRADVLAEVGGLDERYFLYYEDEELCWQVRARGYDVMHLPAVAAMHVGGASSEPGTTWPHLYRSLLIFFARHRPSSYQAVRCVVLARAGIGVATGTARQALRRPTGAARARAWHEVARIAWRDPRCEIAVVAA